MANYTARIMVTKAGKDYEEVMFPSIKASSPKKVSLAIANHANGYIKATPGLTGWRILEIAPNNGKDKDGKPERTSRRMRRQQKRDAARLPAIIKKTKGKAKVHPKFAEAVCKFSDIMPKFPAALSLKEPPTEQKAGTRGGFDDPWDDDYNPYIM